MMFDIRRDDLQSEQVLELLALHLAAAHVNSPPGSVYALDVSGLLQPEVTVWSAWRSERLAGVGALKMLGAGHAEIKSMRTHPDFLRQGAAASLLEHTLEEARRRGVHRVRLETGSGPAYAPALALYQQRGFVNGERFGDYRATSFNQFLHLHLRPAERVEER